MNPATLPALHAPERIAVVSQGRTLTYGLLCDEVDRLRGGLVRLGLEPGDRLALLCANNDRFVVAYLAALGAGLVVVPLNPRSPGPELTDELRRVGARAVVVGPAGRRGFGGVDRASLGDLDAVIASGDPLGRDALTVDQLSAGPPEPIVDRDPADPAALLFTSGTSGFPQASVVTHGNFDASLRSLLALGPDLRSPDDVVLGVLPLFHIFGLSAMLHPAFAVGAAVVLVERFDPATTVEKVVDHRVTTISGPPTLWSALAGLPGVEPSMFATVRRAVSGAAKLPAEVHRQVRERLGLDLLEGYGLTETTAGVATAAGTSAPPGTVGRPMPGVEMRLVDPDGHDVLVGDPGEIWVRGPMVTPGYWGDPAATRAVLSEDGWLRTGDVGLVDDEGWLRIVDRVKDLIIVSGFNVFPAEVEGVLHQHPDIADVVVVGVAHPHSGEAVRAHVVPRAGAHLDEETVIEWAAARLAGYKCPTKVVFSERLPQNPAGKVLRRQLA